MRVLVVDDSLTMRKIVVKGLRELGIQEIEEAADGQPAVDMVRQKMYDCILMDWNMPNMLGIDALKAIRASGNKTPVVMVTTEAAKANVVEAIKAGANNYIMKPFQMEAFHTKLKQILGL